jgi:hypothetical protein
MLFLQLKWPIERVLLQLKRLLQDSLQNKDFSAHNMS